MAAIEEKKTEISDNDSKKQDDEKKENFQPSIDFAPINDGKSNHPSYIILMGDSGLDNFYWQMDKKKQNMTALLRNKYYGKAMITNLAVDESQSRHVLYGIKPSQLYVSERKKYNIEPYPVNFDDSRVYPIAILEEMITTSQIMSADDLPSCYIKPTIILSAG
eukprot:381139_1